jgi:hypothetical protein
MGAKMKRSLVFSALVVAMAVLAVPSYATGPAWTAQAHFERVNPLFSCVVLKLDLQVTQTTASAEYWATDTCDNFETSHLTGTTALTPDQVSLGSFSTASLTNAVVDVESDDAFQEFTFNLTWTGSGNVTVSHPIAGTGDVKRQTAAAVTGSTMALGPDGEFPLFSGSDVTDAEIAQVFHTLG